MDYQKSVLELPDRMRLISKDDKNVYVQARYGPSKIIKLPLNIDEDLSCFTGMVIGDGHLAKNKLRTSVESSNLELLKVLQNITYDLFNIKTSIKSIKERPNKKQGYHLTIYSKAVQDLLNISFEIPKGKKSGIVRVPTTIMSEKENTKAAFIIGLLAAEGSRKGKYQVRMCSASKKLLEDSQKLLDDLLIKSSIESWVNKKYKKEYYSLSFKRYHLDTLMRRCRSGQTGLILSNFKKVTGGHA